MGNYCDLHTNKHLSFGRLEVYKVVTRHFASNIIWKVLVGILASAISVYVFSRLLNVAIPRSVPLIFIVLGTATVTLSRQLFQEVLQWEAGQNRQRVAIYGAGAAGVRLRQSLINSDKYKVVSFVDDNDKLINNFIKGLRVISFETAKNEVEKKNITSIFLAIPSASDIRRSELIHRLNNLDIEIKTIPGLHEILDGARNVEDLDHLSIESLLQRPISQANETLMRKSVNGKGVLVTGGGGSIGSEICEHVIKQKPKMLLILDISEYNLYQIERRILNICKRRQIKFITRIGSVQNEQLLTDLFATFKIDTVFHAAAYKHVPIAEDNVVETVQNNIFGTATLIEISQKFKLKNFCFISTDKAVRPTNVMGATKRVAELICQLEARRLEHPTFSIVRFGNVFASSGSAIPLFKEQIKAGGPITVTHPNVERYFMSISEAAQLVIQATSLAKGGEVFVLEMGEPIKILELAKKMARLRGLNPTTEEQACGKEKSIKIEFTGLRSGEKLYEELFIDSNSLQTAHPKIRMAREKNKPFQELTDLLSELKKACDKRDTEEIKTYLQMQTLDTRSRKERRMLSRCDHHLLTF